MTYSNDIGGYGSVPMVYNTDIGNNDEYTAMVPQAMLLGASTVTVEVMFTDLTDGTDYVVTPVTYNVVDVLPNDVTVRFTLCMSGVVTDGEPCVIGSADEIGAWNAGVMMYPTATPELYTVDVTFLAGGNPSFEYKFKKDLCQTWESTDNRAVTLPTDGTTMVELAPDSWEFLPIGCGLGNTLEEDKVICFQVCMDGIENTGAVCTVGNIDALDNWGMGAPTQMVGPALHQTCVVFEAGQPIPLTIEYKFKKDDCNTWEGGDNKIIVLDNSLATETTVTHNWEDNPNGVCEPVAVEDASWGAIKGMYR
jgi:hypothetical protein